MPSALTRPQVTPLVAACGHGRPAAESDAQGSKPETAAAPPRARPWRCALLLLALGTTAPAQRAAESASRTGVVVDDSDRPLAGARVRVAAARHTALPYAHHTLDVLARSPIAAMTDAQGRFALALTSAHRRLGTGYEPPLTLVIEAEGCQPWHEPLSFGLTGFFGTRAVLHRLTDADLHEITVDDPPPGALLWLRRIDAGPAGDEAQVVAVPAGGIVRVHAPLLPTPLLLDDWRQTRGLGHEVQLWAPGRSSAAHRLDPHTRRLRIPALAGTTRALRVVVDGKDAAGVRALYACPDGDRRWFPSPDQHAREDASLRLLAVTATGRATAVPDPGALDPVVLAAAATGRHTMTVALQGDGQAPAKLSAWLVPLEHWPEPWRGRGDREHPARPVEVAGSTLVLDRADLQRASLLVMASGCAPRTVPPWNGGEAPAHVELHREAWFELTALVSDRDGEPIAGADVRVPWTVLLRAPRPHLVTDAAGMSLLPPLAKSTLEVLCVDDARLGIGLARAGAPDLPELRRARPADGPRAHRHLARIAAWRAAHGLPDDSWFDDIVLEGHRLRAAVRGQDGQPVAFTPVSIRTVADGRERTRKGWTDAFGRVHAGYIDDQATLTCRDGEVTQRALPEGEAPEIELQVAGQRHAVVALPAAARVLRVRFTSAGGVRQENLDVRTDRLLLAWRHDCERCDIVLQDGPPATVLAGDLARADAGPAWIVRDAIVRSVPVHAFCGGSPVPGCEVRAAGPSQRLLVYDEREGSPGRDGAWVARDRAAHEVHVFHREFLPSAPLLVPAAQGAHDPALVAELVRGTPVRFRVGGSLPPPGHDITLTIHDDGQPRYHVTLRAPARGTGAAVELLLPFALPRGHYAADLRTGSTSRRVTFVAGDAEVVVE